MPGRLFMIAATWATSSPAIARSTTASAWSGGRVDTSAERGLGGDRGERDVAGIVAAGADRDGAERDRVDGDRGPPGLASEVVDRASARDGEDPGAEGGFVTLEPADRGRDRRPRLRRDVVGGAAGDHAEIAEERRVELAPHGRERRRRRPSRRRSSTPGNHDPIIVPPN